MNEVEKSQETESSNRQAIEVLKALNHFEYPEEVSRVEDWLEKTKPLQFLVKSCCGRDSTGKLKLECVKVVFDLMATHGEAVSPAIWDILEVVEEDEIKFLTETFLKDSEQRLKNSLSALLSGICQCGQRLPGLRVWCFTYIQALEDRQKYSVLLSVPQGLVLRLLQGIVLPYSREIVYSVFERLLYPMTYPDVFNIVTDLVFDVFPALAKDDIYDKFFSLMKILIERFPPRAYRKDRYDKIKTILGKHLCDYKPDYSLWSSKPKPNSKISTILECPVCYNRFITPVTVCENGHCICTNCKNQLTNCPICRAHFSNIRMTIMDQIMDSIDFQCKNFTIGCRVKLPYDDIWDHEVECEFRNVSCDIVDGPQEFLCNEDVIASLFHLHIEKCHKPLVSIFHLNSEWWGELTREKVNQLRLLKNSSGTLHFIERIYVTDEEIFFSYHYIGRKEDANNYTYTVDIYGSAIPRKITYSNFCLPNYMTIFDTQVDDRCLVLEPDKIFDPQETKFDYSVRIEDISVCRMRLKKNKFMLSE